MIDTNFFLLFSSIYVKVIIREKMDEMAGWFVIGPTLFSGVFGILGFLGKGLSQKEDCTQNLKRTEKVLAFYYWAHFYL